MVVESFDGTPLEGWVGLPALPDGVRAPVALHSSPYLGVCTRRIPPCRPGAGTDEFWAEDPGPYVKRTWGVAPLELVRRGYATAFFSLRGTGGSGGCGDLSGPAEQRDQAALVAWAAAQPWSNGRVGMGGNSWPGTTPWEAAIQAPEGLKTIVTTGIVSDLYTYHYTPQGALWPAVATLDKLLFVETSLVPHAGEGHQTVIEQGPRAVERSCPSRIAAEAESNRGEFNDVRDASVWVPRRFIDRFPDVTAAVLLAHGFQDLTGHAFQDSAVWATTTQAPKWQITGQWGHGPPFAEEPALTPQWVRENWAPTLFGWLDYWLKGVGEPPALGRVDYQDSTGAWRTSAAWPPVEARDESLYLTGVDASPEPADGDRSFVAVRSTLNDHSGAEEVGVPDAAWSAICREASGIPVDTGLAYVSAPVTDRTVIAGNPFAYLTLSSDRPGGVFAVHLLRVPASMSCGDPSMSLDWLATGAADLRFHDGRYVGRDFPTGEPTPVRVDIYDIAEVLDPGDRIAVLVSGDEDWYGHAGQPQYAPTITVHADPTITASQVVLPVVEGTLGGQPRPVAYPPRPFIPTP